MKPRFEDSLSDRLWTGYFRRVGRILKPLPQAAREDMITELEGHLQESFQQIGGGREPDRLQSAIENLGEPETFLRPMMADRLLEDASQRLSFRSAVLGAFYNLGSGIFRVVMAIILSFGYLITFSIGLTAFAKIFVPDKAGFFINQNGRPMFGIDIEPELYQRELLGLWFIPIGIIASVIFYVLLTKSWKLLVRRGH